jgi:hypothetical protein
MRRWRIGRSGMGSDESCLEPARGKFCIPLDVVAACGVVADGSEVSGLDVLDARSGFEGSGEGGDYWVAHGIECTHKRVHTQDPTFGHWVLNPPNPRAKNFEGRS